MSSCSHSCLHPFQSALLDVALLNKLRVCKQGVARSFAGYRASVLAEFIDLVTPMQQLW